MKRILFVVLRFAPDNSVAAIRPTKLTKFLKLSGEYEIDVLKFHIDLAVNDDLLTKDLQYAKRVFQIPYSISAGKKTDGENQSVLFGILQRKFSSVKEYMRRGKDEKENLKTAKKWIDENGLADYDIMISSSGPFVTHRIAQYIKKKYPDILWVADYRDPETNSVSLNPFIRFFARRKVKRVTKQADHIIGATAGCYENMDIYPPERCTEIRNAFDRADYDELGEAPPLDDELSFAFTGTLYQNRTDFRPVFRALKELAQEGSVDLKRITLKYAGRMPEEFNAQLQSSRLAVRAELYGYMPRNMSIDIQRRSHILLLASYEVKHHGDNMSGKVYEYLMSGKPIICTVSGTADNTSLRRVITELDCGICWEEGQAQTDNAALKAYLKAQYDAYIKTGHVEYRAQKEKIDTYDYAHTAAKLDKLLTSLLEKRKQG